MIESIESLDFEIIFFERLVKRHPDFIDALIPLAHAYTKKGDYQKGLVIDKRLTRLCKDDPIVYYNLACSHALLGQSPEAIRALKKSLKCGYRDIQYILRDPDLKSLHKNAEFKKLFAQKKKTSK